MMIRCKLKKNERIMGPAMNNTSTSMTGDRKARYSLWSL
jgi:hypothetical protein